MDKITKLEIGIMFFIEGFILLFILTKPLVIVSVATALIAVGIIAMITSVRS